MPPNNLIIKALFEVPGEKSALVPITPAGRLLPEYQGRPSGPGRDESYMGSLPFYDVGVHLGARSGELCTIEFSTGKPYKDFRNDNPGLTARLRYRLGQLTSNRRNRRSKATDLTDDFSSLAEILTFRGRHLILPLGRVWTIAAICQYSSARCCSQLTFLSHIWTFFSALSKNVKK